VFVYNLLHFNHLHRLVVVVVVVVVVVGPNMGQISKADRFLIMGLRKEKKWDAKCLIKEFHGKRWPKTSITRLFQKIDDYRTIERKSGSSIDTSISVCFAR